MATSRSSRKRIRQNRRHNLHNRAIRSAVKSGIKRFEEAVAKKDVEAARKLFASAVTRLDRAGTKNIIPPNTVARRKSQMACRLNALAVAK